VSTLNLSYVNPKFYPVAISLIADLQTTAHIEKFMMYFSNKFCVPNSNDYRHQTEN